MLQVLVIFVGGGLGALLRWTLSLQVTTDAGARLPLLGPIAPGTLIANLLGSFLLGLLAGGVAEQLSQPLRQALMVGLLGGFTTFSSFSVETLQLLHAHGVYWASLQLTCHLAGGLTAALLGLSLAEQVVGAGSAS
ncbi:MAG: CrcB family protein [Myxococcota bacterium]|nr:CrcB family protein [Myxococcota bacterium]